jgi:hypothetical protein
MPELRIDKFNGGVTDHIFDAPNNFAEAIENMFLDADGKLNQRPGFTWGVYEWNGSSETLNTSPFTGGGYVQDVKVLDNPPSSNIVPTSISGRILMVKASNNLYITYAWVDIGSNGVRKLRMLPFKRNDIVGLDYNIFLEDSEYAQSTFAKMSAVQTPSGVFCCSYRGKGRPIVANTDPDYSTHTNVYKWVEVGNYDSITVAGLPRPREDIFVNEGLDLAGNGFVYTYYFLWKRTYTYGGKSFTDFGPPTVLQLDFGNTLSTSGTRRVTLGKYALSGGWDNGNPTIQWQIYRTEANGSTPYLLASLSNSTGTYVDDTPDSGIIGNAVLYAISEEDNAEPPTARYLTYANDVLWYGFADGYDYRLMYSKPADPDSVPGSFFIDFDDTITGLHKRDIYPIVFTASGAWRVEGITDATGRGQPIKRRISQSEGCVSNASIVEANDKIYYMSGDGPYVTDGFSAQHVLPHLRETFRKILVPSEDLTGASPKTELLQYIDGTYNSHDDIIYWTIKTDPTESTSNSDRGYLSDIIISLDLKSSPPAVSTYYKKDAVGDPLGLDVSPVSIASMDDFLLTAADQVTGNYQSLYKFDPSLPNDIKPISLIADEALDVGILWRYKSVALSLEPKYLKKWVTRMYAYFSANDNQSTGLTAEITSYNDRKETGLPMKTFRDAAARVLHHIKRRFPRTQVRASAKQVEIKNGFVDKYDSVTEGYTCYTQQIGPDYVVVTTDGSNWPAGLEGDTIEVEGLGASVVQSQSLDTLVLTTTIPIGADAEWSVRGTDKYNKVRLEGIGVVYSVAGDSVRAVRSDDA